jgi:formylglycine-generating enzyme required for sulfatase activity
MKRWFAISLLAGLVMLVPFTQKAWAQKPGDTQPVPLQPDQAGPADLTDPSVAQPPPVGPLTDPATPALTTKVNPKDGLTYVWIPAGKFTMGCSPGDTGCADDETPHEVTLSRGFWIGQTPVTQAAYERVRGINPSRFHKGGQLPAERVQWVGAQTYCRAIGMRLPTEQEYEYAARAGDPKETYGELDQIAWYKDNSYGHTHEVATKEPNAWKLYDMLGNVWEYTSDPYHADNLNFVALRGGSFTTKARSMRVSFRSFESAWMHSWIAGFRCVGD